ncbi:MAG: glycosyltransferase family 4 protein [Bacteroidota bacterium]|uniref:glycosyltransferase family 4 protein n=1 Tax=Hydrotalea lipotrueae TaxID=2803817 RepID=UPI001C47A325|nr:glycosyltransferase family 1 protein [Hydrotalea lipotrueae]
MIYINGRFLTQPLTGVQRFAFEIINQLAYRTDIVVVMPSCKIHSSYDVKGWNINHVGFGGGYFWEQIILPFYLLTHKTPLLISLCNLAPIFYRNKITVIHDLAVIEHPEWFNWKFTLFYKFSLKWILYYSKFIISVSNFSKTRIEEIYGIQSAKIGVVYNAVSEKLIKVKTNPFANSSFNFLISKKFILCVASIDPRKNFKRILEAFNHVENYEFDLIIVGKKSNAFKDNLVTENYERIHFIGYVNDEELSWLYKNALFFIYLSLYEGFGIPPLEAMANGCPTLISDIPVHRELYNGTSFFVNPNNIESIKIAMMQLLNDFELRESLIQKGLEISRKYSWSNSVEKMSEILLKL